MPASDQETKAVDRLLSSVGHQSELLRVAENWALKLHDKVRLTRYEAGELLCANSGLEIEAQVSLSSIIRYAPDMLRMAKYQAHVNRVRQEVLASRGQTALWISSQDTDDGKTKYILNMGVLAEDADIKIYYNGGVSVPFIRSVAIDMFPPKQPQRPLNGLTLGANYSSPPIEASVGLEYGTSEPSFMLFGTQVDDILHSQEFASNPSIGRLLDVQKSLISNQ